MRWSGIAVALALTAGCGSGGGLTQSQADACNAVKADAGDVVAQLQALQSGGDQQAAATKIGDAQRDVLAKASAQSGKIATAFRSVAADLGDLKVALGDQSTINAASTKLIGSVGGVNTACHIKTS